MKIRFIIGALSLLITTASFADVLKGKQIYTTRGCASCHGIDGKSLNPAVYPSLNVKSKAEYLQSFKDYQSGKKVNPLMSPMARVVKPSEVKDLIDYVATLKK